MLTLYLTRHGETEENVAKILQGHLPGQLTARGLEQAAALRDELCASGLHFDVFLTSDLLRARRTADIVAEGVGLTPLPCPLLRERDWGSMTGLPAAALRHRQLAPDAETVAQMMDRARRFLIYIRCQYDGLSVLAMAHGLFNRCIAATLQGGKLQDIPLWQNGEVRRLTVEGEAEDGA